MDTVQLAQRRTLVIGPSSSRLFGGVPAAILLALDLSLIACQSDSNVEAPLYTGADESTESDDLPNAEGESSAGEGDGDGEPNGDGDGEPNGDGDGEPNGDGDGEPNGDGDGEPNGDGDGDDDPEGQCADVCGTPNCGACPDGPARIPIGEYSIDGTEVSSDQYAQFLEVEFDPDYLPGALPTGCEFKQDFTPDGWLANPPIGIPVVSVDWCDAMAYCAWAGGHLCGAIEGGPSELEDVQNPAVDEWYRACSGGGVSNYPYGLEYVPTACNTIDAPFGQLTDVGGLASCEGGYDGVFDMSGNVWEWTNACDDEDNECQRRGGSVFSDGPTCRCGIDSLRPRHFRSESQGFRCCG